MNYQEKFEKMRVVGKLTAQCLKELQSVIKPGITTEDINQFVLRYQQNHNLTNAQYGYIVDNKKFPAYCCTSVNEVMCHGIPSLKTILKKGDIVKVDVTFVKDGYHGDSCYTFIVSSQVSAETIKFVHTANEALSKGIQAAQPFVRLSEIGKAIETYCKEKEVTISRDFVGHSIGLVFHDKPSIPHTSEMLLEEEETILKPGMTFTIEPIICAGRAGYKTAKDGWTISTADHKLSAQFEHTLGITETGNEVFTSW